MTRLATVSAIAVNFNGAHHLPSLLASLATQTHPLHEVIIVDNGSADNSADVVKQFGATWVPLGANVGLAPGLIAGVKHASGEFLFFMNNDMSFERSFLSEMLAAKSDNPKAFAIDAVQRDWSGEHVVHGLVRLVRAPLNLVSEVPGYRIDADGRVYPSARTETVYASAANLLVSREDYEELGGFDPGFFLGHEDLDLAWRAWLIGRPVVLSPSAVARHDVSATSRTPAGVEPRNYGSLLGKLRFAVKHLPAERVGVVLVVSVLGALRSAARKRAGSHVRAASTLARELPSLVRERRRLYREAGITPRRHLRRMAEVGSSPVSEAAT